MSHYLVYIVGISFFAFMWYLEATTPEDPRVVTESAKINFHDTGMTQTDTVTLYYDRDDGKYWFVDIDGNRFPADR